MDNWFKIKLKKPAKNLVAIFLVFYVSIFMLTPAPTLAFPVEILEDVTQIRQEIKASVADSILASALGGLVNGFSYFMRKLAYDAAQWVAAGGKGQGALAFQKGFGSYLKDTGQDAAASAIEQFSSPFGLNLCKPPNIQTQIFLQVGISKMYSEGGLGPQPRCSWAEFQKNWSQLSSESLLNGAGDVISNTFVKSLNVSQSDFGVALSFMTQVDRAQLTAQEGASADRLEGLGFKPVTDLISGNIKTPAEVVREEAGAITAKHQGELTSQQIAGIYGAGLVQVIPSAIGVFLNTLTSQLLQKIFSEGILPSPGADGGADVSNPYSFVVNRNRELVEKAFSYLIATVPTQLSVYDILSEYASCPDNGKNAGLNNCVIDSKFRQAIERANAGKPLTIDEAMKASLLDPNAELISPLREADNTDKFGCWSNNKYCYSNIQKLRKVRVLPLGFEIAALKSNPDQPWKLGEVVAGFSDCARDATGNVIPDPSKQFCNLIDPNWVLKLPEAQCQAKVFGPELVSKDSPERREECVDVATCILKNEKGQCINYGYCAKEKNTWSLGAKSCGPEFNTCQTYINAKTNQITSYLSRTLDYGDCAAEAVGCGAYSTEKSGSDWSNSGAVNMDLKNLGRSQTVYFNESIKNYNCPTEAEGCASFYQRLSDGTEPAFLMKKAPDYLGCYDVHISTPVIDWPETEAELTYLADRPAECASKYAGVCVQSEVGCKQYRPADGSSELTGIIGSNACSADCVGYDTFKQEPSSFEPAKFPLYFIPGQAVACSATYEGCGEFTNIDKASQGGESLEYYTDLKYCEKPLADNSNITTYYTWEGSVNTGYVLRVHKLLPVTESEFAYINNNNLILDFQSNDTKATVFGVGSPGYADDSQTALQENYDQCNQTDYNLLINDPANLEAADSDCRAFYDDKGLIYYRLLAKTVTVSPACHALRKTEPNLYVDTILTTDSSCAQKKGLWADNQCQRCYNGGQATAEGSCVYWTISAPGESTSCPASANNCRAYTGNASNNIEVIVSAITFEPGSGSNAFAEAKAGWSEGVVKAEALQVGKYSLEINTDSVSYQLPSSTMATGEWYELSFWTRGVPQNLAVALVAGTIVNSFTIDPITGSAAKVPVGKDWQLHRLGPIQFTGNETPIQPVLIKFTRSAVTGGGSGAYYLDNVEMKKINQKLHLLKNSWKQNVITANGLTVLADAPLACDANPLDIFPGSALGCRVYTDETAGTSIQATGFDKLCRPEAAGCAPIYDSHNTLNDPQATAYEVWCSNLNGTVKDSKCHLALGNETSDSCEIKPGAAGCFIEKVVLPDGIDLPSGSLATSTIFIPADTPAETPLYLTYRSEFACSESYLGCRKVALEEKKITGSNASSYDFNETMALDQPDNYSQTLCRADLVGCNEFKANNNVVYFKDPKLIGNTLCAYRSQAAGGAGNEIAGWFMAGAGLEEIACYPDYVLPGGIHGIWSNQSAKYAGFVGLCPAEQNGCTELVDRADVSTGYPQGKPYYGIIDNNFKQRVVACEGKVSLKEGCVLFDQTENPNKLYDTAGTYAASKAANYAAVPAKTDGKPDANLVAKVDRDRACSEWLACKTAVTVRDENNQPKQLCYEYKACRKMGSSGKCEEWVTTAMPSVPLNQETYVSRGTDWHDFDYSGYSLFNKYPVSDYIYVQFEDDSLAYLAYEIPKDVLKKNNAPTCEIISGGTLKDGSACNYGKGRCYQGKCLAPLTGMYSAGVDNANKIKAALDPSICKAHPEKDSPFSQNLVLPEGAVPITKNSASGAFAARQEFPTKRVNYSQAQVCQSGECSCEYKKVTYKNGLSPDYWSLTKYSSQIPPGICGGGEKDGIPCVTNADCAVNDEAGICNKKASAGTFLGQRGFCLEYDLSHPLGQVWQPDGTKKDQFACLTWLPIQTSASALDLYNMDRAAGYDPNIDAVVEIAGGIKQRGGEYYCAQGTQLGKYYDPAFNFLGSLNISEYFDENWRPKNNGLDSLFCTAGSQAKYTQTVCSDNADNFYGPMQIWAWNNIGENALVLRVEGGRFSSDLGKEDSGLIFSEAGTNTPLPDNQVSVYAFAPSVYSCQDTRNEYGTLMHPPRVFKAATGVYSYWQKFKANPINGGVCDNSKNKFSTVTLSPGPYMVDPVLDSQNKENYVYRSPYEAVINEADIQKLCFVPLMFTDKKEQDSVNPYILSKDFCIDFSRPFSVSQIKEAGGNGFIPLGEQPTGMYLWTYRLAEEQLAKFSFSDYSEVVAPGTNSKDPLATKSENGMQANLARSKISRRYVAVIMDKYGQSPAGVSFANRATNAYLSGQVSEKELTPDPANEPFNHFGVAEEGNWLAIGLDFNQNGEFLGYVTRWFHGNSGENGIKFAIIATLNNQCTSFAQVYDDAQVVGNSNKAWTDRVWQYANKTGGTEYNNFDDNDELSREYINPPFGSLSLVGDVSQMLGVNNNPWALRQYTFKDSLTDGLPYGCVGSAFGAGVQDISGGAYAKYCGALSREDEYLGPGAGYSGFIVGALSQISFLIKDYSNSGLDIIQDLFAKVIKLIDITNWGNKTLNSDFTPQYKSVSSGLDLDISQSHNSPPQIYALNPQTCRFGSTACTAAEPNALTLNGRNFTLVDYDGNGVADEDNDKDKTPDPIIVYGAYTAILQFFAFADDNHMPIRRVMVNWGDDSLPTNYNKFGLYENAKPLCAGLDEYNPKEVKRCSIKGQPTQLTCATKADCQLPANGSSEYDCIPPDFRKFGDSSRACRSGYFEFVHSYTCSDIDGQTIKQWSDQNKITPLEKQRLAVMGYTDDKNICIFQPKVQVLDNWGWCNGTNEEGIPVGYFGDDGYNLCDYKRPESWTYFKSRIIIIP